jgi:hypothetical protein
MGLVIHVTEMIAAVVVLVLVEIMDHVIVIMMMIIDMVERIDRDILIDRMIHMIKIHIMVFNLFYFVYEY